MIISTTKAILNITFLFLLKTVGKSFHFATNWLFLEECVYCSSVILV